MTFRKRMLVLSIIDSLLLLGSWMFALYLIYGELLPQSLSVTDVAVAGLFIITSYFFLVISKSYKTLWKYAGVHELIRVFKAVAAAVILYAAELLLFMREIDDCVKKAHESNRLALAIIGSTARHNNPTFIIGPARESQTFVACFYIVAEREHVKAICEYADGKVDYIFIDAEAKNAEAGDFLTVAKACVLQSEIKAYKGNDITSLACDLLINELVPELKQKKVSIIGAGNLGSKLALTLAERGADVYISRRDQQGAIIAQALNAILPRYSTGRIYNENNIAESVKNADILIGFTQGFPVIDEAAVTTLAKHALIVDGGIGTVKEAAIATARRLAITIIRLDVRIAFSYVIDAMLNTEYFMRHIAGTRVIDGKSYVAGGMIGEKNDIVVADIRKPSEIVGIADGKCGMLPPASS